MEKREWKHTHGCKKKKLRVEEELIEKKIMLWNLQNYDAVSNMKREIVNGSFGLIGSHHQ